MANENFFKKEQSFTEIHNVLMEHLNKETSLSIYPDGRISFFIPRNGDCSFWYDELVAVILRKAASSDTDTIKFCAEEGIDLFDFKLKTLKDKLI